MKYIKKGNTIAIFQDDELNTAGTINLMKEEPYADSNSEKIQFSRRSVSYKDFTEFILEDGTRKSKSDFPTFKSFAAYAIKDFFFVAKSSGGSANFGAIGGSPSTQTNLQDGTIQGTFSPNNSPIATGDTFKEGFQKLQGQVLSINENNILASTLSAGGGLTGAGGSKIAIKPDSTTGATICPLTLGANGAGTTIDNTSMKQNVAGTLNVDTVDGNSLQKIYLKSSGTPTPASIGSRELQLYTGGTNGEVYQFAGNATAQPILINTPPFRFSLTKTFTPTVTVNNGVSYNLFNTVTAGDITGGTTTNMEYITSKFAFQNANLALLFPPLKNYTDYKIRLQLQGTIAGTVGTDRQFNIELRRGADNSLILADYVIKIDGNDLTALTRLYTSFVNGLTDPYITGGLRLVLNNNSGAAITLTGFSLLIQGVSTNFIQ